MAFVKGQSGNPSGRPKVDKTLQDLARSHAPEAIRTLTRIMKDKGSPPAAAVTAAVAILDRAYGKPAQAIAHSGAIGTFDPSKLTDDELATLEPILARLALAGSGAGGNGEAGG